MENHDDECQILTNQKPISRRGSKRIISRNDSSSEHLQSDQFNRLLIVKVQDAWHYSYIEASNARQGTDRRTPLCRRALGQRRLMHEVERSTCAFDGRPRVEKGNECASLAGPPASDHKNINAQKK